MLVARRNAKSIMRSYLMKINHATIAATVTDIHYRLDINSLSKLAAKTLKLNEIGVCNMSVARPIPFDPLRREPGDRRVNSDRSLFQRDGRRPGRSLSLDIHTR
jgi:sulfate adenylyltransferase subunit 1 (EFTu-like GTPase family)